MARGINIQNVLGSLSQLQQSNAAKAERERQERERRRQKKAEQMRMLGTIAGAAIGGSMGGLQGAQMGASIGGAAGGMLAGEGATSGDVQNVVGGIASYQQGQDRAEDRSLRKQEIQARLDNIKQQQSDRSASLRANESTNRLIIDNNRMLSQDQSRLNEIQQTIPKLSPTAARGILDKERPGASQRIDIYNDKDFLQRTNPKVVASLIQNTGQTSNPVQQTAWNNSLAGSVGLPMQGKVFSGRNNKETYDKVVEIGDKKALPVMLSRGRELSKRISTSPPGSQVRLDAIQEAGNMSDLLISHGYTKQADAITDRINKANGTAGEKTYVIFDSNRPTNYVTGVGESQKQQAIANFRSQNPKAKILVNQESNALKVYNGADKYMRMAIKHQLTDQGAESKGIFDPTTGLVNLGQTSKIKNFHEVENLALHYAKSNISHPNHSIARDAQNYIDTTTVRLASNEEFISQMQLHKADGLSMNEIRNTPEYKAFSKKYSNADIGMVDNFIEGIDADKSDPSLMSEVIKKAEQGGLASGKALVSDEAAREGAARSKAFSEIVNKSKEILETGKTIEDLQGFREIQSLSEEERKRLFNMLRELR